MATVVGKPSSRQETYKTQVQSLGQEDPPEEAWQLTPLFLPGESHRHGSLVGYSPKGHKETDMTDKNLFCWEGDADNFVLRFL